MRLREQFERMVQKKTREGFKLHRKQRAEYLKTTVYVGRSEGSPKGRVYVGKKPH